MNITITQDNSRIETLGSNGASIILKLYDLAIDSNNTLTLRGNVSSPSAYQEAVTYLNNTYGPDFTVSATRVYIRFEDANAEAVCAKYFGDGVGCTINDLANADFTTTVNGVNFGTAFRSCGAVKFNEFLYFTGVANTSVGLTYPFRNNPTLTEFTLPSSCTTISSFTFCNSPQDVGANAPTINNLSNITYINSFGFWGWSWAAEDGTYDRLELDWRNIGGIWTDMYVASNSFKGDVILPKYPRDSWSSTRNFSLFADGRGMYITKMVFPETFICKDLDMQKANSCNTYIFLTTTPCNGVMYMWRNLNWGPDGSSLHLYVPKSLYDTMDLTVTSNDGTKQYTSSIGINYGPTPEPLENYANLSDDNKDELVSYGCTATGSTGNWTITPPTT